jgi:hypothetical protein
MWLERIKQEWTRKVLKLSQKVGESVQGQKEMAGRSREWFTRAEREGKKAEYK